MSTSTTDLFVYGTLLFDEVVQAVTNRTFPSIPARLHGYVRCAIMRDGRREPYPAARPEPTSVISGRLLLGVDDRPMKLIERFESDPPDYECLRVQVERDDGRMAEARTYCSPPNRMVIMKSAAFTCSTNVDQRKDRISLEIIICSLLDGLHYVALPSIIQYLAGEWSADQFRRDHLRHYLTGVIPEMRRQSS